MRCSPAGAGPTTPHPASFYKLVAPSWPTHTQCVSLVSVPIARRGTSLSASAASAWKESVPLASKSRPHSGRHCRAEDCTHSGHGQCGCAPSPSLPLSWRQEVVLGLQLTAERRMKHAVRAAPPTPASLLIARFGSPPSSPAAAATPAGPAPPPHHRQSLPRLCFRFHRVGRALVDDQIAQSWALLQLTDGTSCCRPPFKFLCAAASCVM